MGFLLACVVSQTGLTITLDTADASGHNREWCEIFTLVLKQATAE